MMPYLRPCPFCGSKAEFVNDGSCTLAWFVRCTGCRIHTEREFREFDNDVYGKLAKMWNRRPRITVECNAFLLKGDDENYTYEWLPDQSMDFLEIEEAVRYMSDMDDRAEGGTAVAFQVWASDEKEVKE